MKRYEHILMLMALLFLMTACNGTETKQEKPQTKAQPYQNPYVDFKRFAKGRPCDKVQFICLPESQDKSWQSIPTADHIEDLEITPEVKKKFNNIVKQWHKAYDDYHSKPHPKGGKEPMLISSLDKDFIQKVEAKRFMIDMEQDLAKEFPGFWRDVPKKVRYRWIRRAMNKAKRFGDDPKQNNSIVELCARIGLDFDKDPKWDYITKFIAKNRFNIGVACDYIDWTILGKAYSYGGGKITDWAMRDAHPGLPYPKKPYPRLNNY